MRILIVTTGGVTRFFRNWPEVLLARALVRAGHQVTAYTYLDPRSSTLNLPEEEIDGIQVRRIAAQGWYSLGLSRARQRKTIVQVFRRP